MVSPASTGAAPILMFDCLSGHRSMEERRLNDVSPGQISDRPLREANTRGSRHITGTIFSAKMDGPIDWVGLHERRFLIRAELDPRITRILYQPVRYEVLDGQGGSASAFPDFLIEVDGVEEIHEVKPDAQYARSDIRRRLELTARAAARFGHRYAVTLASELQRKSDKAAIEAAWRRVGERVDPLLLLAVDDLLARGGLTIREACDRLSAYGPTIHDFHRMLASGHVSADMATLPDDSMVVHGRGSGVRFHRLIPFTSPIGDVR